MKRVLSLVLIAACVLAQAALCAQAESTPALSYSFEITFLPEAQALTVRQTLRAENRTGRDLDRLMFFVPANCFRRESTLPYDNATLEDAFPAGYAPGGIEFHDIRVNGASADWGVQGENECYLRVSGLWRAGETVQIEIDYTLLITENHAFLGADDREWRITQFYPALCVYDGGDYVLCPLSRAGEWTYSEAADFTVNIALPADYEIAAGGEMKREELENAWARYRISLKNARSLAFSVSRRFQSTSAETAQGTSIRVLGQSRAAMRRALKEAVNALNALETWFGALPWGSLAIVQSQTARSLGATGLILLESEAWNDDETLGDALRYQLARQYFQEMSQADPTLEPWLFEALSQYAALLTLSETQSETAFARAVDRVLRPALQITVPGSYAVNAYAPLFSTQREYEIVVRERGAAVLNELTRVMGRENMIKGMRLYLENTRFSLAGSGDFAAALEEATGRDWEETLVSWIYTIDDYTQETLDYYESLPYGKDET